MALARFSSGGATIAGGVRPVRTQCAGNLRRCSGGSSNNGKFGSVPAPPMGSMKRSSRAQPPALPLQEIVTDLACP
ncbi:hypothetical protein Maq22A_c27895 [Methylobacterium aquaticum]|uniref:Uncharacterized protein n=1 Tax=Methylobacterium aquaticum TaxID=270351 RepID=A0A1Y0ZGK6_9HYPH|nr:hypothetical protein Maq22A_c27895 [Methylobacterium aquaticum]